MMNDRQEIRYARTISESCARGLLVGETQENRELFVAELQRQLERTDYAEVYAACFSEVGDLLSQWRGYAGGSGYSLGFSLEALKSVAGRVGMFVEPVLYQYEEQVALLAPIIKKLLSDFDLSMLKDRAKIGDAFLPTVRAITRESARIKHPTFLEEREWRVFSKPYGQNGAELDFVVRNEHIVPMLKLDLRNGTKMVGSRQRPDTCLRTYRIGPGADQTERFNAFSALIGRSGIYLRSGGTSAAPLR